MNDDKAFCIRFVGLAYLSRLCTSVGTAEASVISHQRYGIPLTHHDVENALYYRLAHGLRKHF